MIRKISSVSVVVMMIMVSLASSITFAQSGSLSITNLDSDGDGICNQPRGHVNHNGLTGSRALGCTDTEYGDLCGGTRRDDRPIGDGPNDSGCGRSQLERINNFWSVARDGDLDPDIIKVNWITDSPKGVFVYQPIVFTKNSRFADREIEVRSVSVSCDSGTGIISRSGGQNRRVPGSFLRARMAPLGNRNDEKKLVEFRVFQREERGRDTDVVSKDLSSVPSDRISGIDEIETTCTFRINQCENNKETGNCESLYPAEIETMTFNIPIDTVAVQPPEFALDAGIALSEDIIAFTEKLIPKFEKFFDFSLNWCAYSITAVLATKFLGFLTGGLADIADLIWYGPEGLRGISLNTKSRSTGENSFVISGRSMCAAAVCPHSWCRAANYEIGTEEVQEKVDLDDDGIAETPRWEQDAEGRIKTYPNTEIKIPKLVTRTVTLGDRTNRIQDSLLLSVGCGCISGILTKLYQLRAIAQDWNLCLLDARTGKRYSGQCDKVLNHGICTFVMQELESFHGTDLISKAFKSLFGSGGTSNLGGGTTAGATEDAREAESLKEDVKEALDDVKDFAKGDLAGLARGGAVGSVGYTELPLVKTVCSLALYHKLPEVDTFANLDLDRPFVSTSVAVNWNSVQERVTPTGQPVFEYSVDWMILAGRDNLRYEIYLQNPAGGKSRNLNDKTFLDIAGDHDSGFVQFLDDLDYTEACINVPNEFPQPQCFPPGRGGRGDLIGEFTGFGEDDFVDIDEDGMSDEWERLNGLNPSDKNDANLDKDRDGRTNLREFREGTDPGVVDTSTSFTGGVVSQECRAVFNKEIVFEDHPGEVAVYKQGESMSVVNGDLISITSPDNGVQAKVEIVGQTSGFRENKRLNAHDIEAGSNFVIWKIPSENNAPPTDTYDVRFSLIKSGALSDKLCTNERRTIVDSVKEKEIVILDPDFSGCKDFGGKDLGERQSCIFGSGGDIQVRTDVCDQGGHLVEYSCVSSECVSETIFCPSGSECQNGECVLRRSVVPVASLAYSPISADKIARDIQDTRDNLNLYPGIWGTIVRESREQGVEPKLVLAIITVESRGVQNSKSNAGAVGVMQVHPPSHPHLDANLLRNDINYNIEKGIALLRNFFAVYNLGPEIYKVLVDRGCKDPALNVKFKSYKEWDAALRQYNGMGCGCDTCDDDYVEKVNQYYEAWEREVIPVV
jgi:hypothetical protein